MAIPYRTDCKVRTEKLGKSREPTWQKQEGNRWTGWMAGEFLRFTLKFGKLNSRTAHHGAWQTAEISSIRSGKYLSLS